MVPEQALREKTSAFEAQAYSHADSHTDYLRRIAGSLSNVERQVTQQSNAESIAQQVGIGTAATTSSNPAQQSQQHQQAQAGGAARQLNNAQPTQSQIQQQQQMPNMVNPMNVQQLRSQIFQHQQVSKQKTPPSARQKPQPGPDGKVSGRR